MALDAKAVTPDDAANLIALIEGTLASRHNKLVPRNSAFTMSLMG